MTQPSHLENFLRNNKPGNPPPSNIKLNSALQEELAREDEVIATDLQRSRAELLIAERRKRIEQLTGNGNQNAETAAKREANVEQTMVEVAQGLLERGMDPSVVGRMVDYMLGTRQPVGGFAMPGMQPAGQQITITDILNLVDRLKDSNKQPQTDPAITRILETLTGEVQTLKAHITNWKPTGAIMVQQPDGTFKKVADASETIVIPTNLPAAAPGSSLEEIKEKNRHDEKIKEIEAQDKRNQGIVNALADIPEKLGEGLASLAETQSGKPPAAKTQTKMTKETQHQFVPCTTEGCGTNIPIPPGATTITCPKCHTEYKGEKE